MTLTGISNRGLLIITVLVAILWGCILAERAIVRQAREETELQLRSRGSVPVKEQDVKRVTPARVASSSRARGPQG